MSLTNRTIDWHRLCGEIAWIDKPQSQGVLTSETELFQVSFSVLIPLRGNRLRVSHVKMDDFDWNVVKFEVRWHCCSIFHHFFALYPRWSIELFCFSCSPVLLLTSVLLIIFIELDLCLPTFKAFFSLVFTSTALTISSLFPFLYFMVSILNSLTLLWRAFVPTSWYLFWDVCHSIGDALLPHLVSFSTFL